MCNEPVIDISHLPLDIQEKVYRPKPGENYNVELDEGKIHGGMVQVVDEEVEDS